MSERGPIVELLERPELSLKLERLQLGLAGLVQPREEPDGANGNGASRAPVFTGPDVAAAFNLKPIRMGALLELLGHAASARLSIRIPLPHEPMRLGPLRVDMSRGHALVLELVVEDAQVVRAETKGSVEPPIPLPLGVKVKGVYLDDDGDVRLEAKGFPDVNLSRWVAQVPRIPEDVDEVVARFGTVDASGSGRPRMDLSGIEVAARRLTVRGLQPISLGPLGQVVLTAPTLLDLDYAAGAVHVRGTVSCDEVHLYGDGFEIERGKVTGRMDLRVEPVEERTEVILELAELGIDAGRFKVAGADGFALRTADLRAQNAAFSLRIDAEGSRWRAALLNLDGRLEHGAVPLGVDGETAWITAGRTDISGRVVFGSHEVELAVDVDVEHAEVDRLGVDLGVADVRMKGAVARGRGHLEVDPAAGRVIRFSGDLAIAAFMGGSRLAASVASAELETGSTGNVRVSELDIGRRGLRRLTAEGHLDYVLASGRIPLGEHELCFGDSASGVLQIDELAVDGPGWPTLSAQVEGTAPFERVDLGAIGTLPAGVAALRGKLVLSPSGALSLEDATLRLVGSGIEVRTLEDEDREAALASAGRALEGSSALDVLDTLREAGAVRLELVAIRDGEIVGMAAFSEVALEADGDLGTDRVWLLAPLAVDPDHQRRRIGTRLLRQGLARARRLGAPAVVALGETDYLARFGFDAARGAALKAAWLPGPQAALELRPGALNGTEGATLRPAERSE